MVAALLCLATLGCGRLGFELRVGDGGGQGDGGEVLLPFCARPMCDGGALGDGGGLVVDAGASDGGATADAARPTDAGVVDAGGPMDAGATADAGVVDAGGPMDAGATADAGGMTDAGTDAGPLICDGSCAWACRSGVCDDAVQVATGGDLFGCARLASGRVACWGANDNGELGDGDFAPTSTTVYVQGLTDAIWLAAGYAHACAVRATGAVVCWGQNDMGDLGDGTFTDSPVPVSVTGLVGAAAKVVTADDHSCALTATGEVWCWGTNWWGQLGISSTNTDSFSMAQHVTALSMVTSIGVGYWHTCALTGATGTISCWGHNGAGQVGDGTMMDARGPLVVSGAGEVTQTEGGYNYNCVRLSSGAVKCWGGNDQYQCGDGSSTANKLAPYTVPGVTLTSIRTGGWHVCGQVASGALQCWGYNSEGELGRGSMFQRTGSAAPVSGLGAVLDYSLGRHFTCAIEASSHVPECWGDNSSGQLGDGTTANRALPAPVLPPP